jgi:hypothetical protein
MRSLSYYILAAAIGFAVAFFLPEWDGHGSNNSGNDTIIVRDTITIRDTLKIPGKKPKAEIIIDTQWRDRPVDTAAILADYHNKRTYNDTIVNDSSLFVVIQDTVTQNKIAYRKPFIVKSYPQITITKTITEYNSSGGNGFYGGGYAGQSFGLEVDYLKDGNMFGIMIGTDGISAKYTRQIKWKKVSAFK